MTVAEPPRPERGRTADEPPRPTRGQTAEERGRDISEAQRDLEAQTTWAGKLVTAAKPTTLLSMAEGYPVVVKQFLQFCLILIYPAWLFAVLVAAVLAGPLWLVGKVFEGVLYALFWPVRAIHKRNNPEEYAAFQEELKQRKEAEKVARQAARR